MDDPEPSSSHARGLSQDDSIINTRSLEAFSRKVQATAGQLIPSLNDSANYSQHYHHALGDIGRELRQPLRQRQLFALAQASPRELVRAKLSTTEIQHRALTYLPDDMLSDIPENSSPFSLFQGFQASLPESHKGLKKRKHARQASREQKLLEAAEVTGSTQGLTKLRNDKQSLDHRLEMLAVRKNMCSTEIKEVDNKIGNLNNMRRIVLDRLADLEQEEQDIEHELFEVDTQLEEMEEALQDEAILSGRKTPTQPIETEAENESPGMEASFMSESIYQKLPTPKGKRPKPGRRKTTYILHEHLQSGSKIREFQAHNDIISALDFDVPFGTLVTAALDDTVRVWDLNAGRCMGLLEGHLSSVRCLQVVDNIVATGSMDASVRLWDLSQADYTARPQSNTITDKSPSDVPQETGTPDDEDLFTDAPEAASQPPANAMRDCPLFTLNAHVAEVTALHVHNTTLVSGSADKTLRQWDLEKGRCVQTLDVLWAAAQAETLSSSQSGASSGSSWRNTGRVTDANADFVGALQCFDAALACGTADSMVRMWDLRSGQVHRTLVGHTGPVTSLQFDDVHLVTGSADRSIRIWDLRTGGIVDAYAYSAPVTSMMFDLRRIVAAAGEDVVKVYDQADGRHWDCGAGAPPVGDGREADISDEVTERGPHATIERVRIKDGYLIEGRRDGVVGVWSC